MKTPIEVIDIRKGDLIRFENNPNSESTRKATEYIAPEDKWGWTSMGKHYLLDRPVPPFEPHWGMVIGHPIDFGQRAVYMPHRVNDEDSWLNSEGDDFWMDDDWAKQKLAEGWVVIEKPEGVK